jgi:hypothetical protein
MTIVTSRPRKRVKLAVVALIAAVLIMQIVIGRDGKTGQALADAMDPVHQPALTALNRTLEGRTEKLKNPHSIARVTDARALPSRETSCPFPARGKLLLHSGLLIGGVILLLMTGAAAVTAS